MTCDPRCRTPLTDLTLCARATLRAFLEGWPQGRPLHLSTRDRLWATQGKSPTQGFVGAVRVLAPFSRSHFSDCFGMTAVAVGGWGGGGGAEAEDSLGPRVQKSPCVT